MGCKRIIFLLAILWSGCASRPSDGALSSTEKLVREWSQDYRRLAAHERFIAYEKPKFWKDCITDSTIPDKGLRYLSFPAIYEADDGGMWKIVKPGKTIEIQIGSREDNIKIPHEYLCQE